MNASRKPLVLFLALWVMVFVAGYLCSCRSAFAQLGGCGECAFCATYQEVKSGAAYKLYGVSNTDPTPVFQGISGQACGANRVLWYIFVACSEGGCAQVINNNDWIGVWQLDRADTCSVDNPGNNDIIEAANGVNPNTPIKFLQMQCGY